jgi:hypothetical protein
MWQNSELANWRKCELASMREREGEKNESRKDGYL